MRSINTDTFDRAYFFFSADLHSVHPDAFELFRFYDVYFFESTLEASEVKWSKRMTMCAGTCTHSAVGSCTITLSEPLLQYRNANELKETLLHEMIHGYLFLTNPKCCLVEGGHGKEFQDLMNTINEITRLSITVYHSFHDEVESFRKHVWKCDGPCEMEEPYFGICKRAMNRPPEKSDPWFEEHEKECGGTYHKIDGPEFNALKGKDEGKKNKREKKSGDLAGINEKSNSLEEWMGKSEGSKELKDDCKGLSKDTTAGNIKPKSETDQESIVGKPRKSGENDRTQQLLDKYIRHSTSPIAKEQLDAEESVSNVPESTSYETLLDEFNFKPTRYKSNTTESKEKNENNCEENPTDSSISQQMKNIEDTTSGFYLHAAEQPNQHEQFDSQQELPKESGEAENFQNTHDSVEKKQNSNDNKNPFNNESDTVLQVKAFVAYFRDSNYKKQEYFVYLLNGNMNLLTASVWIADLFELNANGKLNAVRNIIVEEPGECDIRIPDISTCTLEEFYKDNNNNIVLHPISLLFDFNNLKISLQLEKSFNTREEPSNSLLINAIISPELEQHVKM